MPLIHKIKIEKFKSIIGVWKIDESVDQLLSSIDLSEIEKSAFRAFKNEGRQKQWLASRIILSEISENNKLSVGYEKNGSPFIENSQAQISISHTSEYVTVMLSNKHNIGIDIEKIHPRVLKIRHKFMSDTENIFIEKHKNLAESLILIWSAKEALFKMYGKGNLDFAKNIEIKPFGNQDKGELIGSINKNGICSKHHLKYLKIDDHMLVYVHSSV